MLNFILFLAREYKNLSSIREPTLRLLYHKPIQNTMQLGEFIGKLFRDVNDVWNHSLYPYSFSLIKPVNFIYENIPDVIIVYHIVVREAVDGDEGAVVRLLAQGLGLRIFYHIITS